MTKPKPAPSPRVPTPAPGPNPARWCPARMADFLRALSATQCVRSAARQVGMSRQSAYRMRARLKGQPFDIAWEAAFQHAYDSLAEAALERALHGIEVPVFHKGEQVGSYRRYDERLTAFLLARRNAQGAQKLGRYTAAAEYWSERWDSLLAEVEHGSGHWPDLRPDGKPHTRATRAEAAEDAIEALLKRHLPDPTRLDKA